MMDKFFIIYKEKSIKYLLKMLSLHRPVFKIDIERYKLLKKSTILLEKKIKKDNDQHKYEGLLRSIDKYCESIKVIENNELESHNSLLYRQIKYIPLIMSTALFGFPICWIPLVCMEMMTLYKFSQDMSKISKLENRCIILRKEIIKYPKGRDILYDIDDEINNQIRSSHFMLEYQIGWRAHNIMKAAIPIGYGSLIVIGPFAFVICGILAAGKSS